MEGGGVGAEQNSICIYFTWQSRVQRRGGAGEGFQMREAGPLKHIAERFITSQTKAAPPAMYKRWMRTSYTLAGLPSPSPAPYRRKSHPPRLPPLRTRNSEQEGGGIYRSACWLAISQPLHKARPPMAPQAVPPCTPHSRSQRPIHASGRSAAAPAARAERRSGVCAQGHSCRRR